MVGVTPSIRRPSCIAEGSTDGFLQIGSGRSIIWTTGAAGS